MTKDYYNTLNQALEAGLKYLGFRDAKSIASRLNELISQEPEQLKSKRRFSTLTLMGYRIKDLRGDEFYIGVEQIKEGFDPWVINSENGIGLRV